MELIFPTLILPVISAYILLVLLLPTRFYILRLTNPHFGAQLICISLIFLILSIYLHHHFETLKVENISETSLCHWLIYSITLRPIFFIQEGIIQIFQTLDNEKDILIKQSSLLFAICIYLSLLSQIIERMFLSKLRKYFDIKMSTSVAGRMAFQLTRLMYNESAILITLKNNKVYVGYITYIPAISAIKRDFTILPLYSGYRDANQHLILTNDYKTLWDIVEEMHKDPDMKELSVKHKDKVIVKIDNERMKEIARGTSLTLNCNDIAIVGEWIPELYDLQSVDDSQISRLSG